MDTMHPTSEWKQLQNTFYRFVCSKQELYNMSWNRKSLHAFKVAVAPLGGPIALVRSRSLVATIDPNDDFLTSFIYIHSSSGGLQHRLQWDRGSIVAMGWTSDQRLVCVSKEGAVGILGVLETDYISLGSQALEDSIIDCKFWENGLVALTGKFDLIICDGYDNPRPQYIPLPTIRLAPCCWELIPPHHTLSRHVELLYSIENTVILIDPAEVNDQMIQKGPFKHISVSSNGELIALYTKAGKLWVVSSDFQRSLIEVDTNEEQSPEQMTWSGSDSIVLNWGHSLQMFGPNGENIIFPMEEIPYMIQEVDGIRLISPTKCEFLQKVPVEIVDIFGIGSTTPGALLFDAWDHFEKKNPKADENIRSIQQEMSNAVDNCIEAAGNEFSITLQKRLLKAATFGKSFLSFYNSERFVNMCKTLRILNAVRNPEVGISLTYFQYHTIGLEGLILKLIGWNHHLLALRICEFMKLNFDKVLIHWACAKILATKNDDELVAKAIIDKMNLSNGVSFAEIAKAAHKAGCIQLATMLLDYEIRASDQVPLLLNMNQNQQALTKAVLSGDTDLVFLVLFHLKDHLTLAEFFRIISTNGNSVNIFATYCQKRDTNMLRDYYYQDDRQFDSAFIDIDCSIQETEYMEKETKLRLSLNSLKGKKEYGFELKVIEDELMLLQFQSQMEADTGEEFRNLSITETIYRSLCLDKHEIASKLRTTFGVSEKRFWWIKIGALSEMRKWDELDKFARSKKSPIGYVPFVDACVKVGQLHEAMKYIAQFCDPATKPKLFLKIGAFREAGEAAFLIKDPDQLRDIRMKCNNALTCRELDVLLQQLSIGR